MAKDIKKINRELRAQAVKLGLCGQWQKKWDRDLTQEELVELYVDGIDFGIRHDWPSAEYMAKNFDHEVLHENGVWVNEEAEESFKGRMVLNGSCAGDLHFGGIDVVTIYVRHTSSVRIVVDGYAMVFVMLYDKASVEIVNRSVRKQKVITYSDGCSVTYSGDVDIRERSFNDVYKY